jgi:CheY-like chemotaxis protein
MRKMKVIPVVEDQAIIRMGAVQMPEDAGLAVVEACNACDAMAILENCSDVRAVFTDINFAHGAVTRRRVWIGDTLLASTRTRGLQASNIMSRPAPSPTASAMSLHAIDPNLSRACAEGRNSIRAVTLVMAAMT